MSTEINDEENTNLLQSFSQSFNRSTSQSFSRESNLKSQVVVVISCLCVALIVYLYDFLPSVCSIDRSNVSDVYRDLAYRHFKSVNLTNLSNHSITSDDIQHVYRSYHNVARFRWQSSHSHRMCLFICNFVHVKYVDIEGNEHSYLPQSVPSNIASRVGSLWTMLQEMVDMWDPIDLPEYMDVILNISDGDEYVPVDDREPLPILFSACKREGWRSIPFVYFVSWFSVFERMDENVRRALNAHTSSSRPLPKSCVSMSDHSNHEWNQLKHLTYWRGSTTGGLWSTSNFASFPRFTLANISHSQPSLIDARLTTCTQCDDNEAVETALKDALGDHFGTKLSAYDDLVQYQGLIDVDGNTWSSRAPQLMATGAVMFKQNSPFYEFWNELLEENVHYIPIQSDLSDLVARVTDVLARPESQIIGQRGQKFAHEFLSKPSVFVYAQHVLKLYARLLKKPD